MKFEFYGITDIGLVRQNNEDSFIIDQDLGFAAIADGMGGHFYGEIASQIAVTKVHERLKHYLKEKKDKGIDILISSINEANKEIFEKAQSIGNKRMGTTLTSILLSNTKAYIAHIGDSRAYLIRDKKITQLTEDDSFVMEQYRKGNISLEDARNSPFKNILTKALGINPEVTCYTRQLTTKANDILLLASDGLTNMLKENEILSIITNYDDIKKSANELVNNANIRGGQDNITVIIIKAIPTNIIEKLKKLI